MTVAIPEFEQVPTFCAPTLVDTVKGSVSRGEESSVQSEGATAFDSVFSLISFSGMTKTPLPVSQFVAKNFSALDNVQAVLAGESQDVLHVWVMIRDWTPEARKQVYAIQKTILKQLEGLHFDFYVVDLPEGMTPEEMVSDIPVEFKRAQ